MVHWCANVLPFAPAGDADAWCVRHRARRGDVVPLPRVLDLARAWYGGHLREDWRKGSLDEAKAIVRSVGLAGDTWTACHRPDAPARSSSAGCAPSRARGTSSASTMIMTTAHSTADLLEHLQLILPCNVCGTTYTIPASLVRDSQQAIAHGCCGSGAITSDAEFYAGLIAPEAIAGLNHAWEAFRHSAEHQGGLGVALRDAVVMAPPAELDELALQRWEGEGGSCVRATLALDRA